jgi:hypothetical protein
MVTLTLFFLLMKQNCTYKAMPAITLYLMPFGDSSALYTSARIKLNLITALPLLAEEMLFFTD